MQAALGNAMSASKEPLAQNWDKDEIPDLSTPERRDKIEKADVRRGRPPAELTKISTPILLDAEILERFRAGGPGWQSRINQALREWLAELAHKR